MPAFLLLCPLSHIDCNHTSERFKNFRRVLRSDGSCAIIEAIEVEILSAPETTYNFEAADFHTQYVSDSKVLVHNA